MSEAEPRVLLVRFGALGNALVCIPAVRALRRAWPGAWLGMVADPLTREALGGCPYIDEFLLYDSRGEQRAGPGYLKFILELRRIKPTHSIHFRRRVRSELLGLLSGAAVRVGFATEERLQLLTHKVPYPEGTSVIELNLSLVRALGIEASDPRLEYWPPAETGLVESFWQGLYKEQGPVIIIHPAGATQRERLWPFYGQLAQRLREEMAAQVVVIGIPQEEPLLQELFAGLSPRPHLVVGWPIPQVAELIRRAALFIGTDSGPCHLADAVGTPAVILYAPQRGLQAQLRKWKPEGPQYIALLPERDCGECGLYPCARDRQRECAAGIKVDDVLEAAGRLLSYGQGGENGGNTGHPD